MILTDAERASITRCIDEHGGVCREVMCDESLDVVIDQIVRRRAAQAWDQGWAALREFAGDDLPERPRNPYRGIPSTCPCHGEGCPVCGPIPPESEPTP